jgi:hypothetical protein
MPVAKSVKRAALVCADALSGVKWGPVLKKWGIKDKRYGSRLISKLRETFSLAPAPRKGRPAVYAEWQLAAAEAALASGSRTFHSGDALVQELKEQQVLPADAKKRGFMPDFKQWLRRQGQVLAFGGRSKQQGISVADEKKRLAWCKEMEHTITEATLPSWVFEDEKVLGSRGKYRGEGGG